MSPPNVPSIRLRSTARDIAGSRTASAVSAAAGSATASTRPRLAARRNARTTSGAPDTMERDAISVLPYSSGTTSRNGRKRSVDATSRFICSTAAVLVVRYPNTASARPCSIAPSNAAQPLESATIFTRVVSMPVRAAYAANVLRATSVACPMMVRPSSCFGELMRLPAGRMMAEGERLNSIKMPIGARSRFRETSSITALMSPNPKSKPSGSMRAAAVNAPRPGVNSTVNPSARK